MAIGEEMSDEYVTELLKKDAEASSIKYSTLGLQAFLPKRSNGNAPKPNTRFLQNLIRETDSHNTALLAKEQREARSRQDALRRQGSKSDHTGAVGGNEHKKDDRPNDRRSHGEQESSRKRRRSRSPHCEWHERKRRRDEESDDEGHGRSSRGSLEHKNRRHRHRSQSREHRPKRSGHGSEQDNQSSLRHHKIRSVSSSRPSSTEHRSRHPSNGKAKDEHRSSRRARSRSLSSSRSLEVRDVPRHSRISNHQIDKVDHHRSRRRKASRSPSKSRQERKGEKRQNSKLHSPHEPGAEGSDSDPLEAILCPKPPPPQPEVRTRGRGVFTTKSAAMDSHFRSTYDPSADVQPDPDNEDDWDQALEALRDRQKWKQQGADRLRSAGFSELEVNKWEKGGEKDESDVKWAKKGEGREWDRGKAVDTDGGVELKADWGRLKDS